VTRSRPAKIRQFRFLILFPLLALIAGAACAQGGPPYYTTDPDTPGNHNWEINIGYMPFLYSTNSLSHVPDVDINFGIGKRIQLTYESAWLRLADSPTPPKYGLEQDQLGVKWRFYENEKSGLEISVFPQLSINNPNNSVARGLAPPGASLLMPMEFSKKFKHIQINWEGGYNFVHLGPDGWIAGIIAGHDLSKNWEIDGEFFSSGSFRRSLNQETVDFGARYKIHPPFILLLMVGRSIVPSSDHQPFFVGYFGMQILLPPAPFEDSVIR
jgi:hypothetical protein